MGRSSALVVPAPTEEVRVSGRSAEYDATVALAAPLSTTVAVSPTMMATEGAATAAAAVPPAPTATAARAERLVGRLDAVRDLGRSRRLRIQLPLGISGMLIASASIVASWTLSATTFGAYGIALGPWLLLLCVMPNGSRSIGVAAAALALLSTFSAFNHALTLLSLIELCSPSRVPAAPRGGCAVYRGVSIYAVGVLLVHAAYAIYMGVALFNFHSQARWRWLPVRPPRATLISLWRIAGSVLLFYAAPTWAAFSAGEFTDESLALLLYLNTNDAKDARTRAAARLIMSAECVVLGCLAFWPGLRTTVQARLASIGEGVAAAGGISELFGGSSSKHLIAQSERTLRSVRLDLVRPEHFDRFQLPRDAYAVSTAAQIGSIDVRATSRRAHPPRRTARADAARGRA